MAEGIYQPHLLENHFPSLMLSQSSFPRFFQITFQDNLKRTLNPFDVEKSITDATSHKPKQLFSINTTSFIIETEHQDDGQVLLGLSSINDVPCQTTEYTPFNTTRGIVYIREFGISSPDSFKEGLFEMYRDIKDATLASFMKPRSENTHAVLLTFSSTFLPYNIYIATR